MNRLLLCASLLLLAGDSTAQKFSLGVNGGISASSGVRSIDERTELWWPDESEASFSPCVSIKGIIDAGSWQFGLSLEAMQAKYRSRSLLMTICYLAPEPGEPLPTFPNYIALDYSKLFPLRAFISRKISFEKLVVYGGFAANYIVTPDHDGRPWFGYGAGAQCGMMYPVSKRVSINLEASGDKMWFKQGPERLLTMYNTTALLGLTYRLK